MKNKVSPHYKRFLAMLDELKGNLGVTPMQIFSIAKRYFDKIDGLGGNVTTEILNTYMPSKYPILNDNPLSSLNKLGLKSFPSTQFFRPETYGEYAELMSGIARMCDFQNLSRVDHFMNFVYWKYVKM
jgi:hypothetical protein